MNFRRILGFIIAIIGVLMIIFSFSIKNQTEEGHQKVRSAQKKVDSTDTVLSLSPYTKQVGKGITGSAQKKIDTGKEDIAYYETMAKWLKIGGIAAIIAGVLVIVIPRQNKRRH